MTTKQCRKCLLQKELEEFSKNRANPDGLDRMCKQCWKERPRKSFVGSTKPTAPAAAPDPKKIPDGIELIELGLLRNLPKDRKWMEWKADLLSGVIYFQKKYGVKPRIAYLFGNKLFSRYFIGA